jgi:hypothetical protein
MTSLLQQDAKVIDLPMAARRRTLDIVKELKVNMDVKLDYLFDGLGANVADALFEEMWGLDEHEALEHHFNVMRALKVQSDLYRGEFTRLMKEVWLIFLNQREDPILNAPRGIAETLITTYKSKTESHYKVFIKEVRLRMSRLLNRDLDEFPLRPEIFFLCFWQALEQRNLRYDERVMLLPLFQRFVRNRYGQVLAAANQTLIEHGVEVKLEEVDA